MITSFFRETFCTGIDYSEREDCLGVAELSEEEAAEIVSGKDYDLIGTEDGKTLLVDIFEGPKWQAKQAEIQRIKEEDELAAKTNRKLAIIDELGALKSQKDGLELVLEDTAEIDEKIADLKEEYSNLI